MPLIDFCRHVTNARSASPRRQRLRRAQSPAARTSAALTTTATTLALIACHAARAQEGASTATAPPLDAAPKSTGESTASVDAAPLIISTDRPSFSDSTGISPVGHVQLETGFTYTYSDRDDAVTNRVNGPEMLARLGVIDDRFELRAIWAGWVWTEASTSGETSNAEGPSDVALGFKLKLWDESGLLPRAALVASTTIGAGGSEVATQQIEPVVKFAWSYDLGGGVTLGGNANAAWPTTNGSHFAQGQWSIYASCVPIPRTSLFVEYFGLAPNAKDSGAANYVDFGGTLLLNDRVQLDARVGFGLNEEADDVFAGVGVSFLF